VWIYVTNVTKGQCLDALYILIMLWLPLVCHEMFLVGHTRTDEPVGSAAGSPQSAKTPRNLNDAAAFAENRVTVDDTPELVLWAQEQERERIAVELHDSTSQHLVAIGLGLAKLRRTLDAGDLTKGILDDISSCVADAAKEIRVFSYLMKPSGLERDGLRTAVTALVSGFGLRTDLDANCRFKGNLDGLNFEVGHAAFRVLQEALSNVYRHARAEHVEVDLVNRSGVLSLRIADDGQGIDESVLVAGGAHRLGVGIVGMRTRVQQLGGTLEITSAAGGTTVSARMRSGLASARPRRTRPSTKPPAVARWN
jgi:two-component system, NarL family, sensor kinase